MFLLNALELTLPLKNPVLIFAIILFIILFAPILLNKLKIPHLIGLIIAGAIIGPHGFNLMLRDSSIILFGTVGLLYIMFLAGLEIDLADFKKNSKKSLLFGIYTFIIPMIIGTLAGYYVLHFSILTSVLMASMFASHTLIAYPIISKLGVAKNQAVNIAVGGTIITDTLALLVLAAIVGITHGEVNTMFWVKLSISIAIFALFIIFIFPIIGRWFFKRFDDSISQYIFVLAMVFFGSFLAEAAGVEPIIGAFLVGLSLNKLIPHTSPLMNRVEFVGNALFIPFFLIGVGMLIDYRAFFKDLESVKVALVMVGGATLSKFIVAWISQKAFKFSKDQRRMMFGLINAHAAAALAAVLVGYNIILNQDEITAAAKIGQVLEPVRLFNESILNGTILMILVTCTMATFIAQKGAQNIALSETSDVDDIPLENKEKILVSINNVENTEELMNLSLTIKSKSNKTGVYALNVIDNSSSNVANADKLARRMLDKAAITASATDVHLHELLRYDVNRVNGITSVVREHRITDLVLGLHEKKDLTDNFLGKLTEGLLNRCNATTLIYKPSQPLSTIKRHIIVIPDRAEKEIGFPFWLVKVWNIARNTGAKLVFYSSEQTLNVVRDVHAKHPIECDFVEFGEWNDFLILSRDIRPDDNLIVVMSRKDRPSHNIYMSKIPAHLSRYFKTTSFIMIYPMQSGIGDLQNIDPLNASVVEPLEKLDDFGKTIASIFKLR